VAVTGMEFLNDEGRPVEVGIGTDSVG